MAYRSSFIARRGRVLASWVTTLFLTAGVAVGIVAAGHHLSPVATTSATATTATTAPTATTATTATTPATVTPISVTFRGDDLASSSGDR